MKSNYTNLENEAGADGIAGASRILISILFCIPLFAVAAFATPPFNDNFSNAQVFTGVSGQAISTTIEGTLEPFEPPHAQNRGGHSIWFKYVAPGDGVLSLDTSPSGYDTTLAVYRGTSLANLVRIAENDNYSSSGGFNAGASVLFGTQSGATYYIAVDGAYNYDSGFLPAGTTKLDYTFINKASNDSFSSALPLPRWGFLSSATTTNLGASKESGEPNHANNPGGKSIWFRWDSLNDFPRSITLAIQAKALDGSPNLPILAALYTGNRVDSLTPVTSVSRDGINRLVFTAAPNSTYYLAIDGVDNGQGSAIGNFSIDVRPSKSSKTADFDNDGKADFSVYRPTTGTWYSLDSVTNNMRAYNFGLNGDRPLIGDFGHDGKIDHTVFRPDNGVWYVNESNVGFHALSWGTNGDIPLLRKVTFQDTALFVIFRPNTGTWWITNGINTQITQFGQSGDIPMLADFNGDGTDELTVFRPSNGVWYILFNANTMYFQAIPFGKNGDVPVPADYDADGRADVAIYRPVTGTWWIMRSTNSEVVTQQFGIATDIPQPADYDGDGDDDIAIYRGGVWWIRNWNGTARAYQFGLPSDIPLSAPTYRQ